MTTNIHESELDAHLRVGYVILEEQTWRHKGSEFKRYELAIPEATCCRQMREYTTDYREFSFLNRGQDGMLVSKCWGLCVLNKGHLGRHSTVGFYCDGCGHMRRGGPYYSDENVSLCFLCHRKPQTDPRWGEELYG